MFFRFNPIHLFKKIISDNKNWINNTIMYISYNLIYYITGLQILCNKSYKLIKPFVLFIHSFTNNSNAYNSTTHNYNIFIIANGIVMLTTNKEKITNDVLNYNNQNINFDFVLYSHVNNKVLYKIFPTIYEYNILSYKFINAELISKSQQKINISFVTSSYNYFIENNFIDKHFILYFMNTHYKDFMITLPPDDLNEYTMNIIDDKINIIEISNLDTILLKKNKYIII